MSGVPNTPSVLYYDSDGIAIYHGDSTDFVPTGVDLLLTDPPYGINLVGARTGKKVRGDDQPFDPRPLTESYARCVIFGANHFAHLLPPGGWVIWSKRQDNRDLGQIYKPSTAEVAWTNIHNRVYVFNYFWAGGPFLRAPEERGNTSHPTLKPVALMRWILQWATEKGDLVYDPFMGSGPVAKACRDLGRRYIGVELEEGYCEAAVQRLAQEVMEVA